MCADGCIVGDDVGLHIPRVHLAKQGAGFPPAAHTSARIDCLQMIRNCGSDKIDSSTYYNQKYGSTAFIVKQATAE